MKLASVAMGGFLLPLTVFAHHAEVGLDRSVVRELEGEVTRVAWVNPHVRIWLDVDGVEWTLSGQPLIGMTRLGVPRDSVQNGQTIKVAGFARPDDRFFLFLNILLADGTELLTARASRPRWSDRTIGFGSGDPSGGDLRGEETPPDHIFRVWPRTIEVQNIRWPDDLPLTAYAQAVKAAWRPALDTALTCVAPGMPRAMAQNPFAIEFVDQGTLIELRLQEFDQVRTIHMPGAAVVDGPQPSPLGYSTGHWESETTLVVHTTAISYPFFHREGVPLGDSAEIVERFALSEDRVRLNYEITVTDPEIFTEPVTGAKYWDWKPGVEILPYEGVCE